jgi:glycosyltransferase involved in cell wall biosynthesis
MKFLIFCPVLLNSAIGRMSAIVTKELLAQGHQVIIVRSESIKYQSSTTHSFFTQIISWQNLKKDSSLVKSIDQIIYHVGDNFSFHEGCVHWLKLLPGIVCLHDYYLGHLFYSFAKTNKKVADDLLNFFYGKDSAKNFFSYPKNIFIEKTYEQYSLIEWIVSMAQGIVIHSQWPLKKVLSNSPAPIKLIPLAYNINHSINIKPKSTMKKQLLTVGYVNKNKRIDKVIEAIGLDSNLRNLITYNIVGLISNEEALFLKKLARKYKVSIKIFGEVAQDTLNQLLYESDLVSCLRYPSIEGASASIIEAMLYGKPVICTDTGFYSEIPDKFVVKINPSDEIKEIRRALNYLCNDLKRSVLMGKSAQKWAEKTFSAVNYAKSLVDFTGIIYKNLPILDGLESFYKPASNWPMTHDLIKDEFTIERLRIFEFNFKNRKYL